MPVTNVLLIMAVTSHMCPNNWLIYYAVQANIYFSQPLEVTIWDDMDNDIHFRSQFG